MMNFFIHTAKAHENYVLTQEQINEGMRNWNYDPFTALNNSQNFKIALFVALGTLIGMALYFIFQHSQLGRRFDAWIRKGEPFGDVILRVALALSFIASAYYVAYLGPEIHLSTLPLLSPAVWQAVLYILGFLLLFGLFSRFVGIVSMVIFLIACFVYKDYMVTYFNYFGEFLALILFGTFVFALDRFIFKGERKENRNLEIALIRITYGISILYPAISIKILHPKIIIDIVNQYNLTQFHWLFPNDPLLISLGTGLAQIVVGIAIALGFQTRINTMITFGLMFLSVIFFKEAVWPHIILLALALYLMINNGGDWTLDNKIGKWLDRVRQKPV